MDVFKLLTLSGVVVVSSVALNGAQAENFNDALAKAYVTNPSLLSARATLRATDEGVSQARSGWRPSVSASSTLSSKRSSTSSSTSTTRTTPKTVTLSISQSLYAGGQTNAAIAAADHSILSQRATLLAAEQNVLLAGATAYLNVLRDQAVFELNIQNEKVLSRHLDATRDRFNVGEITRTDVHLAEARLAGANAFRIQSKGTLESSRARYENLFGDAPSGLVAPAATWVLPASLDDAMVLAEANNPSIQSAVFNEKSAQDAITGVRGQLLPSLSLSGSANRSLETSSRGYWSNSAEAKLTLSIPLYQSGSVYSQLRQSRQSASALRFVTDQTKRDISEQVRTAWQNVGVVRARIESVKTQIHAATTALEGIEREASVGSRTVLDVLDSEQELLDARVNLVEYQRDKSVAALTLLSSTGQLTAASLNLAVDLYDVDGHYQDVQGKWFGGDSFN